MKEKKKESKKKASVTGIYRSSEKRNQKTGEALFTLSPFAPSPYVRDGLVHCRGRIPVCVEGTPVSVTGTYSEEKGIFFVSKFSLYAQSYEATAAIIAMADPELTKREIDKVYDATCGDGIFEICRCYEDPEKFICDILKGRSGKDDTKATTTAKRIIRFAKSAAENQELSTFLLMYDVPIDRIEMMFKKGLTADAIRRNPYRIFRRYDVPQIIADAIAWDTAMGERESSSDGYSDSDYSELRLSEYSQTAAKLLLAGGGTAFTLDELVRAMNFVLKRGSISKMQIGRALANFCVCEQSSRLSYHEYNGIQYVESDSVWQEESLAVFHMRRLQSGKRITYSCRSADEVQKRTGMIYNSGQRHALNIPRTGGVKILTGPPGSGKTAAIKGIIESFETSGRKIKLAATTGMAAKVMAKATERDAQTLNMLLHVIPFDDTVMSRSSSDPIDADLVIVDEVSMMGLKMFSCLVQAVRTGAVLLLVGDEDQLQSVEYGSVLHDLIESGIADVYRLSEILRQSGTICENAACINAGSHEIITDSTFEVVRCMSSDDMLAQLKERYRESGSQILCPVHHGTVSVESVNSLFEKSDAPVLTSYGKRKFHVGDKIVMTRTDYDCGYTNGDIGYITGLDGEALLCRFSDAEKKLARQAMHDMEHADCITIHKSQGNEFDTVHVLLPQGASSMMTRRLLYTAVTRAKKKAIIYTSGGTLESAIDNRAERKRFTLLAPRLEESAT